VNIPGAERTVVDVAKVRDYLLSLEHPVGRAKAQFFEQLGFSRANSTTLRSQLQEFASGEAELGAPTPFGQKYVVRGTIRGTVAAAAIVTVWIVLHGEDFPRFVTAFPGTRS
jgi:hypothetical protein